MSLQREAVISRHRVEVRGPLPAGRCKICLAASFSDVVPATLQRHLRLDRGDVYGPVRGYVSV